MKKLIVLLMASLLLAACGTTSDNTGESGQTNGTASTTQNETENAGAMSSAGENSTAAVNTEQIPENPILNDNIDMSAYKLDVKEDNPHKRIVILKNKQGKEKYKSIFIKKTGRMKLIECDNGLLFNQVIE